MNNPGRNSGSIPKRPKFKIAVDEEKKKPSKKTVTKQQTGAKRSLSNTENTSQKKTTTGAVPKSTTVTTKPRKALADLCQNTNLQASRSRNSSRSSVQTITTTIQNEKLAPIIIVTEALESLSLNDKSIEQISRKDQSSLYKAIQKRPRKSSPCKLETITEISLPNDTNLKASDSSVSTEDADISFTMLDDSINYEKLKQSVNIITTRGNYSDNKGNISDVSFSILNDGFNFERLRQSLNINMVRGDYTQYSSDEDDDFKSTRFCN